MKWFHQHDNIGYPKTLTNNKIELGSWIKVFEHNNREREVELALTGCFTSTFNQ